MNEPKELSRCPGRSEGPFSLPDECTDCQRLLRGYPPGYFYIKAPAFVYDKCPAKKAGTTP